MHASARYAMEDVNISERTEDVKQSIALITIRGVVFASSMHGQWPYELCLDYTLHSTGAIKILKINCGMRQRVISIRIK